jgi:hypothetical protein
MGVLGYIGIFQHKEHSPEVVTLPRGTPCIHVYEGLCIFVTTFVTNLTMVTFIIKVINIHMVCMVALVLWLFSVMHNFHTGSETHLDAYCTGTEVFFWGQSGWGVMLPTHLHLALRLRTCRAMPLLPLHASVACAVTTVYFCIFVQFPWLLKLPLIL